MYLMLNLTILHETGLPVCISLRSCSVHVDVHVDVAVQIFLWFEKFSNQLFLFYFVSDSLL